MSHSDSLSRRRFLAASAALLAGLPSVTVSADADANANEAKTRSDAQLEHTEIWIDHAAKTAPLAMRFKGETKAEFEHWHKTFTAKLRSLLGPHRPPAKWTTTQRERTERDDHIRYDLLLSAKGHPTLPVYLLMPKGRENIQRPAVLALHGHGNHGHHTVAGRDDLPGVDKAIASANYDYGRQLVRKGYVVAAPCFTPFGARLPDRDGFGKQDACAVTFVRLQLLGRVLMAENLRDALWSFEFLAKNEGVDADRIGCVGLSYGGRMTMLTAALEPRIKVAVVSGALNVMQERVQVKYSCGAQVIPGLLNYGDVPEIGGLIAPRPAVWEIGSQDSLIRQPWADESIALMRRSYKAAGVEKNLIIDRFEGSHRWNGKVAEKVLANMLKPAL